MTSVSAQFIGVVPYCERIEAHLMCLSDLRLAVLVYWRCQGSPWVYRECLAAAFHVLGTCMLLGFGTLMHVVQASGKAYTPPCKDQDDLS